MWVLKSSGVLLMCLDISGLLRFSEVVFNFMFCCLLCLIDSCCLGFPSWSLVSFVSAAHPPTIPQAAKLAAGGMPFSKWSQQLTFIIYWIALWSKVPNSHWCSVDRSIYKCKFVSLLSLAYPVSSILKSTVEYVITNIISISLSLK